VRFLKITLGLQ